MIEALFPLHPRLVHFPMALLLVGIAAAAFGLLGRRERWLAYGRVNLGLGWLGVVAAIASGLVDQSRAPQTPEITQVINQHITAGIALLVVVGLAIYWPLRDKHLLSRPGMRWAYLALLGVGLGLVLVEGFLGGKLVYSFGVGVR